MADESTNIQTEGTNGGAPAGQTNTQAQGGGVQNTQTQQQPQNNSNLRTFTQEQLDAIISRERSKAVKGLFTQEQMAAKDNSIASLTTERDTANANLAKLQAELNGYKNEKYLTGKGVPAEMVDFYAFKIGKLVTDEKTFEQAAEEYLKDNPPAGTVRMSTGGGVSGGGKNDPKPNDIMNALIRGATK